MTEIIFDRNYIEDLHSANYFGSTTDYSETVTGVGVKDDH